MAITEGQILLDSALGGFLAEQARTAEVIVEVGTGSGLGSTRCLAEGIKRRNAVLNTCEADRHQCAEAGKNILPMLVGGSRIMLRCGVFHRFILPYYHPHPSPQTQEMWEHERKLGLECGIVEIKEPKIDLLFLDGGEFTSLGDFLVLWERSRVIVIDDCDSRKAVKNAAVFNLLFTNPSMFEPIRIELTDRNGWAAFRSK